MAEFVRSKVDMFLGVVRKYMQVRGPMSQKELAEVTEVGVSTMSRFLNQKTGELNAQLIAKIVAKLNIPLHEMIDFVEEDYADRFIRLVKFYKEDHAAGEEPPMDDEPQAIESSGDELADGLSGIGGGARNARTKTDDQKGGVREKLESLTPRQRAYITDFLDLDMEGRDLMVDIGNNLLRYLRHKGMNF